MAAAAAARPAAAQAPNYPAILKAVARDIAALKPRLPQLKDFSLRKNLDRSDRDHLVIDYDYRTHDPRA
jgi:hypothetical protein